MIKDTKIIKSTIIYFLGNVLSKLIVFFMLPIYTEYIPASSMGYYDTAIAVVTLFASVFFLDIGSGIMRFIFEQNESEDKNYPIYSGLIIFFISLLLYLITIFIIRLIYDDIEYYFWIVLYGFLSCFNTLYGYISRGLGFNKLYAFSGIISTIVNVLCNLIFILLLKWDYKSLYVSFCISMFVHIIILELKCKLIFNFKLKFINKNLIKKLYKFSLPLALNSVAFWLLNSGNRVIVSTMLDTTQNGYLSVAFKFTSILYLFSSCFQLAWQELAFSRENNINKESTGLFYTKAFDLYVRILFIGLFISIPIIKIIFPYFIDSSYNPSAPLIPLALFGTIMTILGVFLGSIFGGIKKTNIIFVSSLLGAIVNVIIILLLINKIGVMAANYALIAGFSINVLIRLIVLKKIINMKFNYWYFLIIIPFFILVNYIYNNANCICNFIMLIIILIISLIIMRKDINDVFMNIRNKRRIK